MEPGFLKMTCFLHPWCSSVHHSLCRKVIQGFKYLFLKFTYRRRKIWVFCYQHCRLSVCFGDFFPPGSLVKNRFPNSAVKAVVTLLLSWLASIVQHISAVKRLDSGHKVLERAAGALGGSLLTLIRALPALCFIEALLQKSPLWFDNFSHQKVVKPLFFHIYIICCKFEV